MKTLSNIFSNTFSRILIFGIFFLILFQNTVFAAESVDCEAFLADCMASWIPNFLCYIAYAVCLIIY